MSLSKKNKLFNIQDIAIYFAIAATGAVVQLVSCSILQDWFQMAYETALLLGYWLSFVVGFVLTKLFAFNARNKDQTKRQAIKFMLVSVISCLITVYGTIFVHQLLIGKFQEVKYIPPFSVKDIDVLKFISQTTAMGASFVNNYVLHKVFTFKDTGFYEKLKRVLR